MESSSRKQGGILVIVDSPPGLEFGIDCMTYETGPKFRGICMIPAGLHFVYHSSGMCPRQGFFMPINNGDIIVKCWDPTTEEISLTKTLPEGSMNALISAILNGELDTQLGPYPLSQHHLWQNNSNLLNLSILKRADIPLGTLIYPGDADDLQSLPKHLVTELKPYFPDIARIAKFSNISEIEQKILKDIRKNPNNNVTSLTCFYLDQSSILEGLIVINHGHSWEDALGELQLSFLLFLLLYSNKALNYWKAALSLICQSEKYLLENIPFTITFLRILYEQLNFTPVDFFETELSSQNFLRPAFSSLFSILNSNSLPSTLLEHKKRLLTFIQKKFNLFEESDVSEILFESPGQILQTEEEYFNLIDEDKPVIVMGSEIEEKVTGSDNNRYSSNVDSMGNIIIENTSISTIITTAMEVSSPHSEDDDLTTSTTTSILSSSSSMTTSITQRGNDPTPTTTDDDMTPFPSSPSPPPSHQQKMKDFWIKIDASLPPTTLPPPPPVVSMSTIAYKLDVVEDEDIIVVVEGDGIPLDDDDNDRTQKNRDDSTSSWHKQYEDPRRSGSYTTNDHPINTTTTTTVTSSSSSPMLTPLEIESHMYSWRYPFLFENINYNSSNNKASEDFTMAAVRLLEEISEAEDGSRGLARKEAQMFILEEVPKRAGVVMY